MRHEGRVLGVEMKKIVLLLGLLLAAPWDSLSGEGGALSRSREGFGPGARVLLDAHNCYPEHGPVD